MSTQSLAWAAIAALAGGAMLADSLRRLHRYLAPHRYGTRVSTTEWRALMREADMDLTPPVRRYEGAPGVSSTVRPEKQSKVQTIDKARKGRR